MIVNYTQKGWEIITQRAHGLLAAQVAMHWRKKDRPKRWTETIIAIAEHDDAQTELQADDLLTPQGGPVNFKMKKFDPEHCKRLQDFSFSKSRYIALLTSMHMCFLHAAEAGTNPLIKPFITEQEKLQAAWRKQLNISKEEIDKVYALLEWCDAFSLLLAQHEVQPENRVVEVSSGPDKKQYQLLQNKNGFLTVNPWPFEEESFDLTLETRIIPTLQFKDSGHFKEEMLQADVIEKVWKMQR